MELRTIVVWLGRQGAAARPRRPPSRSCVRTRASGRPSSPRCGASCARGTVARRRSPTPRCASRRSRSCGTSASTRRSRRRSRRSSRRRAAASVTEAIVALEVMYDYLDGLSEQPGPSRSPTGASSTARSPTPSRLPARSPTTTAITRGATTAATSPRSRRPRGARCGRCRRRRSSRPRRSPCWRAAARRRRARTRSRGSGPRAAGGVGGAQPEADRLRWSEVAAGAAASVLAGHALVALAADPGDDGRRRRARRRRLLRDVRAHDAARQPGRRGGRRASPAATPYLAYYASEAEAAERLGVLAREAVAAVGGLPRAPHHLMTVAGAVAFYLSAPRRARRTGGRLTAPMARRAAAAARAVAGDLRRLARRKRRRAARGRAGPRSRQAGVARRPGLSWAPWTSRHFRGRSGARGPSPGPALARRPPARARSARAARRCASARCIHALQRARRSTRHGGRCAPLPCVPRSRTSAASSPSSNGACGIRRSQRPARSAATPASLRSSASNCLRSAASSAPNSSSPSRFASARPLERRLAVGRQVDRALAPVLRQDAALGESALLERVERGDERARVDLGGADEVVLREPRRAAMMFSAANSRRCRPSSASARREAHARARGHPVQQEAGVLGQLRRRSLPVDHVMGNTNSTHNHSFVIQTSRMTALTRWVLAHRKLVVAFWVVLTHRRHRHVRTPRRERWTRSSPSPAARAGRPTSQIAEALQRHRRQRRAAVPVVTLPAGRTVAQPARPRRAARGRGQARERRCRARASPATARPATRVRLQRTGAPRSRSPTRRRTPTSRSATTRRRREAARRALAGHDGRRRAGAPHRLRRAVHRERRRRRPGRAARGARSAASARCSCWRSCSARCWRSCR